MEGAQLPLKQQNKKKEVRGKKPQQEVDLDNQSAAAPHGGPCGSSGILNVSVGERGRERRRGGGGKVGAVQPGGEPESEPEAASAETNRRISLPHNLEIPLTFFRQIEPRGQEAAAEDKVVQNKHKYTQKIFFCSTAESAGNKPSTPQRHLPGLDLIALRLAGCCLR